MYGEVLSAANPAALLSSVRRSLVHPVVADPGSIGPKTSQVGAKMGALAQLKSEEVRVSKLREANQDEQSQLPAKLEELDKQLAQMILDYDDKEVEVVEEEEEYEVVEVVEEEEEVVNFGETAESLLIWVQTHVDKWEKIEDPTVTITLPNTPAQECLLAARHLLVDKREQLEKADQAETKLGRDINALQMELPRWRRLLFFFSGNGRLLNRHRFACFLVIALVFSSALLYLSSDGSTGDPAGSKIDDASAGSVYGMLRAHCDHVPTNGAGAYFDFWTIWVLITAYCAVSGLFVSKALLHDLAQAMFGRVFSCRPTKTQQTGQRCSCCAAGIRICSLSPSCLLCTSKSSLQV
jgi:hypothetical protein